MNANFEQVNGDRDLAQTVTGNGKTGTGEIGRFFKDVEELLKRVSHLDDADVARLRQRVESSLHTAQASSRKVAGKVRDASSEAAKSADNYAHESPWTVVGVAAIAALAIGAALGSRR